MRMAEKLLNIDKMEMDLLSLSSIQNVSGVRVNSSKL